MKDQLILLAHLLTTISKLMRPGGARAVVSDSLLMKQQLLIINRSRRRAPSLSALDRFLFNEKEESIIFTIWKCIKVDPASR